MVQKRCSERLLAATTSPILCAMNRAGIQVALWLLVMAAATVAAAQDDHDFKKPYDLSRYEGRPRVKAVRLNPGETISVDGQLEEAVWQRAMPAADFKQQDPHVGE